MGLSFEKDGAVQGPSLPAVRQRHPLHRPIPP
jgi:hypothetical protein